MLTRICPFDAVVMLERIPHERVRQNWRALHLAKPRGPASDAVRGTHGSSAGVEGERLAGMNSGLRMKGERIGMAAKSSLGEVCVDDES
jgi:hypothetical protein